MTVARLPLPPKLLPVFSGKARYRGAYGGRGSGKTRSFALMTAVDGYRLGKNGVTGQILCGREHLNSLEESSMQEVKTAIRSVPWLNEYYEIGEKYIRSRDKRINYTFTGLRNNLQAIKSKSTILRCWIDEAEDVPDAAYKILIPTIRAEGPDWQSEIWVNWNPGSPRSATHKRFRDAPPEDSKIVEMNWYDNPWFPKVLDTERQSDKLNRPETYEHIWEGAFFELTDALIFKGRFRAARFEPELEWNGPYYGLDFGFGNDPTAAVECYIFQNTLYIRRAYAEKQLQLDHTAQTLARHLPRIALHTVRADNSRPESIAYLRRSGMPGIVPCKKGNNSVTDGVEYLKAFDEIIIHEDDAVPALENFSRYMYKVDRLSGDVLPSIVDAENDSIDAVRYALEPMIKFKSAPGIRIL